MTNRPFSLDAEGRLIAEKSGRRRLAAALVLLSSLSLVSPLVAWKRAQARAAGEEDFFMVSSVDTEKKRLLLKRPTEVTEVMLVTEKTIYLDEEGTPLHFKDLRAGDTVYVTSMRSGTGDARVALRIRKGPMTAEELRRRYLPRQ